LLAGGDVERNGEHGGDRARVAFRHRDVVDGQSGERRIGLERLHAAEQARDGRAIVASVCRLLTICCGCEWSAEPDDHEDEPKDAVHRLRSEPQAGHGARERCEPGSPWRAHARTPKNKSDRSRRRKSAGPTASMMHRPGTRHKDDFRPGLNGLLRFVERTDQTQLRQWFALPAAVLTFRPLRGRNGRGWDRTSDLPRVKRALSR
jgi:hypothetical protein